MGILSDFPTTNWRITLNADNPALVASDFTITSNTVVSLSGTELKRTLVLDTATANLLLSQITISRAGVSVVEVENAETVDFLNQIRWLLNVKLTESEVPNEVILRPYLATAENEIYGKLGITETAYQSRAATDAAFKEKTISAMLYSVAALLVPAVSDVVQETLLGFGVRYVEWDPEKKIAQFNKHSQNHIEDYIPTENDYSGYAAGSFKRKELSF